MTASRDHGSDRSPGRGELHRCSSGVKQLRQTDELGELNSYLWVT